jgi:hypothetical protein
MAIECPESVDKLFGFENMFVNIAFSFCGETPSPTDFAHHRLKN